MRNSAKILLLAIHLIASSLAIAAEAVPAAVPPPAPATPATGSAKAATPPLPADVQRLQDQYNKQRTEIMDERNAAAERLRKATTEKEKARIIEQLRQQQQQRMDQQRELQRQIREQLQQVRDATTSRSAPVRR